MWVEFQEGKKKQTLGTAKIQIVSKSVFFGS